MREQKILVQREYLDEYFPPNSGGIACWVAELNAVLDAKAMKMNILNIYFPRVGIEPRHIWTQRYKDSENSCKSKRLRHRPNNHLIRYLLHRHQIT